MRRACAPLVLFLAAACGEPQPETIAVGEPVPYDAEEAAAYARRQDELRGVLCGDRGGELRPEIPERLDVEIASPEQAWAYVTDPDTPFPQRMRAAREAGALLPYDWVQRAAAARKLLQRETALHQWGRRASPTGPLFLDEPRRWHGVKQVLRDTPDAERERALLGHVWTLPREPQGFLPVTWTERCAAPWPFQVGEALDELFRAWAPKTTRGGLPRATPEHVAAWLDAVLEIPIEDQQDVWFFFQLTMQHLEAPDLRVFRRVLEIALDARFGQAAGRVAEIAAGHAVCWDDPDAGYVAQALLLDVWESGVPPKTKHRIAYAIRVVGEAGPPAGSANGHLWPATLMLEASRRGLDPSEGDAWSRAYCYLFSVCEAHPDPPFRPSRHEDPDTAESWIAWFRDWFTDHEAELDRWAAAERDGIARARRRLRDAR